MNKLTVDEYFSRISTMLQNRDRAIPSLLVDLDLLDHNLDMLKHNLNPNAALRLVVKSLPSSGMLDYIRKRSGTDRLMVFHQPFLTDIARQSGSEVDILLGKPMPVKTAGYFYKSISDLSSDFDPGQQVAWLIDTKDRLLEYRELSKSINQRIKVNLEINVGLHRGGFATIEELKEALDVVKDCQDQLLLDGLMGYDPHVAKLPSIIRSRKKSMRIANEFYQKCKDIIQSNYPSLWSDKLIFNGAGSPTVNLHALDSPLNDISVGSALVKPTTFDIDTLSDYKPSAFIATPILKKMKGITIPGLERLRGFFNLLSGSNQQSFFIYGGFWKADYCYPLGVRSNKIYGESTNQTMINVPSNVSLNVDDFVFLRPHQSEYVFLHFGKILAFRSFAVVEEWGLLDNG